MKIAEIIEELCNIHYFELGMAPISNLKYLNSGSFSIVYSHLKNSNIIIKVFRTTFNESTHEFYDYCYHNYKNNSCLPKIYYLRDKNDLSIVIMEKLYCDLSHSIWKDFNFIELNKTLDLPPNLSLDSSFKDVFDYIKKLLLKFPTSILDLNNENINFRKNGEIVINDPLFDEKYSEESLVELENLYKYYRS